MAYKIVETTDNETRDILTCVKNFKSCFNYLISKKLVDGNAKVKKFYSLSFGTFYETIGLNGDKYCIKEQW